jgi:PAS domain S-box-containing protein
MSEAAEPWLADLRTVLDHVPSMVSYWDGNLICRFANRAYERWFGVQPDDLIGTHLQDLLGPTLYELNRPHRGRLGRRGADLRALRTPP